MGSAPRVKPGWMLNARHERSANKLQISFYTVALEEPGFPVYFMCPACPFVHCHPENPIDAKFGDPGEAIQEFQNIWIESIQWIFLMPALFLQLVNSNG